MRKIKITVTPKTSRLDLYLAQEIKDLSRSKIKKLIEKENITVNSRGVESNYRPKKGDEISIEIPPPKSVEIKAENIPLKIIYEDTDILVIDKEAGMVTHPTLDHPSGTLVNALLYYLKVIPDKGKSLRPGIVHRLDRGTSGIIVIAKNEKSLEYLKEQFRGRKVVKKYICLVQGKIEKSFGKMETLIDRHPINRKKFTVSKEGKESVTLYHLSKYIGEKYSLLEVEPKTGRTHQIRVHMSHIGHPIIGDKLYGGKMIGKRQFLHASYLEFTHPVTGESVHFESKLPSDLQEVLNKIS